MVAQILYALGEYEQARTLDEDTLARRRRVLGEDHPQTLLSSRRAAVPVHSSASGSARGGCVPACTSRSCIRHSIAPSCRAAPVGRVVDHGDRSAPGLQQLLQRPRRPRNQSIGQPPRNDRRRHIACCRRLANRGDLLGLAHHTNASGASRAPGMISYRVLSPLGPVPVGPPPSRASVFIKDMYVRGS
jgi:hypothetical protein